jgi:arylsulfatase A-like enzyme
MNRRTLQKQMIMGLAVAGLIGMRTHALAEDSTSRVPNIVYILADDIGYGDVSVLNSESKIQTPNINRLANKGMYFNDARAGSSVYTPTHYGILAGRYCWRTRLKRAVLWNYDNSLMKPSRLNVASCLKQHGYNTAMVGKWYTVVGTACGSGS